MTRVKHMSADCDQNLLDTIGQNRPVRDVHPLGGFAFDMDFSQPYIATAIHSGTTVEAPWKTIMELDPALRQMEEDAATDTMINGLSNAVWGLDSRAVYDLNRPLDLALPLTPEQFWGIRVYRTPPTDEMNTRSRDRHQAFYRFMKACTDLLLERFGFCIVYDIHSYNILRQQERGVAKPPVFNLGTGLLDRKRWSRSIDHWLDLLAGISVPGVETTVAENLVFHGKGGMCQYITAWDPRILVLPTEVAKVYMDEITGTLYPDRVAAIAQGLSQAIVQHVDVMSGGIS